MSCPAVLIRSFGERHAPAPASDLTLNVRRWIWDLAATRWCLPLTGLDQAVREHVLHTEGALDLLTDLEAAVRRLLALDHDDEPVAVSIGCSGGRHRSVALAEELASRLRAEGWTVAVEHRDVGKPILRSRAA